MTELHMRSVTVIETMHFTKEVSYEDAMAAVQIKRHAIQDNPKNWTGDGVHAGPNTIYIYTPSANRTLDALGWAITRMMRRERQENKEST